MPVLFSYESYTSLKRNDCRSSIPHLTRQTINYGDVRADMPSRFTNDMFAFIMFSQLFIISIYRDSAVKSDYALGKERLQSGWRKEYLSRHNETEARNRNRCIGRASSTRSGSTIYTPAGIMQRWNNTSNERRLLS